VQLDRDWHSCWWVRLTTALPLSVIQFLNISFKQWMPERTMELLYT
jgi:hypothetical protein